uniref:uncharacterized protein LOC122600873 n=1 Tax=Erigeron canadensis TaxID=72917 RepID=UPI001CB89EC5|nr:uncharacterized protein LOC122600873 [Erigeron canadensis]
MEKETRHKTAKVAAMRLNETGIPSGGAEAQPPGSNVNEGKNPMPSPTQPEENYNATKEKLGTSTLDLNSGNDVPKPSYFAEKLQSNLDNMHQEDGFKTHEGKSSGTYANALKTETAKRIANFRKSSVEESIEGADLALPRASVEEFNGRFVSTLYGYFLRNRLAFPVVENYVKNTWAKYGLKRVMMNTAGFFFFKFDTKQGMDQVLERGPWIIRSVPILLNVWNANACLTKEETSKVPVWIKLHDIPLVAYTEDGLSMIATKLGTPIMLDSYTSNMCLESWGRNNYARAMIELNASCELKEEVIIAIPNLSGEGYSKETVYVEYEWSPSHCSHCKLFGHNNNNCPKQVHTKVVNNNEAAEDGFTIVNRKKGKGKASQQGKDEHNKGKHGDGFRIPKPKPNHVYRQRQVIGSAIPVRLEKNTQSDPIKPSTSSNQGNPVQIMNKFESLSTPDSLEDSDDDEVIFDEATKEMVDSFVSEGASTPGEKVPNV